MIHEIDDQTRYSLLRLKAGSFDKGGINTVEYPRGYLYSEAVDESYKIAKVLDELVMLRLEDLDLFVRPDGAVTRPYDYDQKRFLDEDEARIQHVMRAAIGKEPEYKIECPTGTDIGLCLQRIANFSLKTGHQIELEFNGRTLVSKNGEVEEMPSPYSPILKSKYVLGSLTV